METVCRSGPFFSTFSLQAFAEGRPTFSISQNFICFLSYIAFFLGIVTEPWRPEQTCEVSACVCVCVGCVHLAGAWGGGVYRRCRVCNLQNDTLQMGKSANQQQLLLNAALTEPKRLQTTAVRVRRCVPATGFHP